MSPPTDHLAVPGPAARGRDPDVTGAGPTEESTERYYRSSLDVLHLTVWTTVALTLTILTVAVEDAILGFEQDLILLFDFLSPTIERFLQGALELAGGLFVVGVYVAALLLRRFRLFGYLVAASFTAFVVMSGVDALVRRETSSVLVNRLAERAGIEQAATSGVVGLAQLAAIVAVQAPFVGRRWRRAGVVVVAVLTLLRLLVSARLPADLVVAPAVGAAVGALVLVGLQRPDRRPTFQAVAAGLAESGLDVETLTRPDPEQPSQWEATVLDDHGARTGVDVKVVGLDARATDLMTRSYRFLRLKDVGDLRPFSSFRRRVEHEALVSLLARDVGTRTPRVRAVVDLGNAMLIAHDRVERAPGAAAGPRPDEVYGAAWSQMAILRRHGIAHRNARFDNVVVDTAGAVWLTGLDDAEIAAPSALLDADVAELLTSQAMEVGPERAVESAAAELGPAALGDCLPRLQPRAMSRPTQAALKTQRDLLARLQTEIIEQCGAEQVELAELERINRQTVITLVALVAATYFLLPQFADLPGIVERVRDANWAWAPLMLLTATFTFVAAAISIAGATPGRLAAGPLFASRLGTAFAGKLGPGGVGAMALSVRFLQRQGIDRAVAVSSVGLDTVGGVFGHLSLVAVFIVWAGTDAFGSIDLPDPTALLVGFGVVVALLVVGMLLRPVREIVLGKILPVLRRSLDGVASVLRQPSKVAMLYGGSVLITLSALVTMYLAVQAFGGGLPFATVGAVFLIGAAVAQIAPTPGGVGAMEAALIGGLVAAGLGNTLAVPAVFLFRLFTFWLPVLPGWLAFTWLQRNDYL